jgi:hypothetical protein
MYDALTNPPVPEWNNLTNDERTMLVDVWEMHSCPHACGGSPIYFYAEIRKILKDRERRILAATMTEQLRAAKDVTSIG